MIASQFLDMHLDRADVAWMPLGDITKPTKNIRWQDTDESYQYIDLASVDIETKTISETIQIDAESAPSRAQKIVASDDVIFATTRPTQLRYCLIDDEYDGEIASTGYCILRANRALVIPKWILHWLSTSEFKRYLEDHQNGAAYPAISDSKVKAFQLPIPCPNDPEKSLEIQAEIVRILDKFVELKSELTIELKLRTKQYNYCREQLLTFNDGDVDWKTLGEIAKVQRGASPRPISKFLTDAENGVPWIKIGDTRPGSKFVTHTAQKITQEGALKSRILSEGSLIISNSMSFGRPYILGIDGAIHDGWAAVSEFESTLHPGFLYHYLSSHSVQKYWLTKINSGAVSNLNSSLIQSLPVPIPCAGDSDRSLERQLEIADTLDVFDTLTTSVTEGLPREIVLREKQYAYYRDELLSFPRLEGEAA